MSQPAVLAQPGPTAELCRWISTVQLGDIPPELLTRAKYLILDGIACALVGAHLPWSEKAAAALLDLEYSGPGAAATLFGWDRKVTPLTAALLNGTFIQGFELDDWHRDAPLHSNSILLPALLAAAEHMGTPPPPDHYKGDGRAAPRHFSGADLLLAYVVGCEVGPRVGLGLRGADVLSHGWHSGAVFGPSAAAAAVSKLLGLSAEAVEDALGIACTQAGGLMSAQFESEVKRMQHGFAARNGLLGATLARGGYVGIKKVYERKYGGFLTMFSSGNGKEPQYKPEEVCKDLGKKWQIEGVLVKPYAAMAGTHCTVDCLAALRAAHPERTRQFDNIKSIRIEMSEAAFHHGGWKPERPLTATGAQMCNAYVGATYLVDEQVTPAQFRTDKLDRDQVWQLVDATTCEENKSYASTGLGKTSQRVTISFKDGSPSISHEELAPKGVLPPLTNQEILYKWRLVTQSVIEDKKRDSIEHAILKLQECTDISVLGTLMAGMTKNPIA
ncbi:uncharacterized protein E0L32_001218 [Thyridium curvatum]|uniref:Uncharacterized protein n=1 Tax=Thyridium curvatum TaxID=1093900 RepID=A0A507AYU0_9PEZI|nr:uncharacterized protein E0L32_001218 [Thyridium curvatum]TPX10021.1 hypothetical protein E0L32_001218 [Thyridium curvatum]